VGLRVAGATIVSYVANAVLYGPKYAVESASPAAVLTPAYVVPC